MNTHQPTYIKIVQAASRIVERDGAARLTLDAAAREAGVSKGGVLYHFPTKEALIRAMLDSEMQGFETVLVAELADDPDTAGSWLRAYIRASFQQPPQSFESGSLAGLLAAVATNPELIEPFQQRYSEWQATVEADGLDPVVATLIRLAADGLWFSEFFKLGAPDPALRERVIALMVEMTQEKTKETSIERKADT